jgi:hypothetical protein
MEEGHLRRKRIPHPSYPFKNAKHWRLRAEAMRTLAEETIDSTVRAMMLRIAAEYDRLAESADDRAAHDSIMFRTAEVRPESLPETRRSRAENSGRAEGRFLSGFGSLPAARR